MAPLASRASMLAPALRKRRIITTPSRVFLLRVQVHMSGVWPVFVWQSIWPGRRRINSYLREDGGKSLFERKTTMDWGSDAWRTPHRCELGQSVPGTPVQDRGAVAVAAVNQVRLADQSIAWEAGGGGRSDDQEG